MDNCFALDPQRNVYGTVPNKGRMSRPQGQGDQARLRPHALQFTKTLNDRNRRLFYDRETTPREQLRNRYCSRMHWQTEGGIFSLG